MTPPDDARDTVAGDPPPGVVYAQLRTDFVAMMRSFSPDEVRTPVPQCPEWSVGDVLAHVVGINADFVNGELEGIGSDAWTAAQVRARSGQTVAQICDEWLRLSEKVDALTAVDTFTGVRLTADLVTHQHDVLGALGRAGARDTAAVRLGLLRYGPFFCQRSADAGLPIVRVVADRQSWQSGDGEPAAVLDGSAFELLRAFSGRRSAAQIMALNWIGDPGPYLAVVTPYGLPAVDIVE